MRKAFVPLLAGSATLAVALGGWVPGAQAASRLVILPVVVGGGTEPEGPLMSALGEGLRQNPQWAVEQGDAIPSLAKFRPVGLTDAELERFTGEVEAAAKKAAAGNAEAIATLERVRTDLRAAAKRGPRGEKGDDLLWRASLALITAAEGKDAAKARTLAEEALLLLPGRKLAEADKVPSAVAKLLETPPAATGARLKLLSRPEGCEVFVDGRSFGNSPVEISVLQEETYWAHTRCAPGAAAVSAPATGTAAPAPAASPAGGEALASLPKKVSVPAKETQRQDVLDAEFERAFVSEGMRRLRFASAQDRRQVEESYARRVAERFDADVVVLASMGELSGAEWLNARLYLRSGYLNRQGFVRLEPQRANALGRYLATGKDVPGVLKPEEAGALVAASRNAEFPKEPAVSPWYTDIAGWSFVGAGLVSLSAGRWATSNGNKKQTEADDSRDADRRPQLYQEAQSARFWGGVGTVGGLLLMSTGVILLLVPEYNNTTSELFAVKPTLLQGGGGLTLGGRF